jgi:PhnB protein
MPERDPAERFDELVQAMLAGAAAGDRDAALGDLLQVAADVRGLAREEFREHLGVELLRAAAHMPKEAEMTTTTVPGLRTGFHAITPYLHVARIEELLAFVKEAFGAVETMRQIGSAGGLHAEVRIGDSMVMMGGYQGMTEMPTALHLYVEDADSVYARAVAAGATTLHPLVDQPYGDREASVRDPFGNHWYIATHTASPATGHRPEGLRTITPYLHPRGAQRLIDFLRDGLGAEETFRHQSPDGVIHHAKMKIGDAMIEMGEAHGQWQPMPAALYLYVDDVDARYEQALRAGGTSRLAPTDQPYGDRTAYVQDLSGNIWYLATPIRVTGS